MDNIPDWFYRVSVKALVLSQDKNFLLVKEEKWRELPWWWLEFGETPQECIKRELMEEMWINVKFVKDTPSYFITTKKANWTRIANVIYEVHVDSDDLQNFKLSDECLETRFFNTKEAEDENLFPNVREFIKQFNPLNH